MNVLQQIALEETGLALDRSADREERFAALVERQSRFLFRVAYALLRNVADAEDAVQETFLRVYRRGWDHIDNERAFLARTVWRIARDRLPASRVAVLDREATAHTASPESDAIAADRAALVHRLIDALPEELRQPLALSSVDELNSREIAKVMGIPEGTVRTRLLRARRLLSERLAAVLERRS